MTDTNTVQYWVEQVNTKIESIVSAMKTYVEDFSLDVEVLPDGTDISTYTGVANKMYLLKDASVSEGENWYNEYIYVNNKMELIGTTKPDIKSFYTKAEIVEMLKSYYLKTETYSKTEVDTELGKKANSADVYTKTKADELLGAKANSADVYAKTATYSKTEADALLADKANSSDVYTKTEADTAISTEGAKHYLKTETYTKTEVNTELGKKANSSDVYTKEEANTAISTEGAKHYLKTETYTQSEVDTALSAKADSATTYSKTEVDTALSGKADVGVSYAKADTYTKTEVNTELGKKANSADVYAKTATYSKTEVDGLLDDKADAGDSYLKSETYTKTEVNTELGKKANSADVYTKTVVDTELGKKANSADVYTTSATYSKSEVDGLVAGKVVISKVTELPATGAENTIYVVSKASGKTGNLNSEYLYVNGKYELLGAEDMDLSGYYTSSQVDGLLANKADSSALSSKANSADVYTKSEVDTELGKKLGTGDKAASASTADTATSATTATKDASGNVITTTYATKTELASKMDNVTLADVATSGSYNDLSDKPTIPTAVTSSTVSGWGFTKNAGTVTSVNNIAPVNGNVTVSIPSAVTETTVSGWGFTKNAGSVVSVNGSTPDANGNVTVSVPSSVTESTVSGWGFTKNAGTVTKVKINNVEKTPTSGVVDLGTVLTAHQDISGKANAADVYTKTEIDTKLGSVYKYKGSVANYAALPTTGLTAGDVYNVEAANKAQGIKAGDNVAWTGTAWDVLSGTVDLSGYSTTDHKHSASDITSGLATVATSGSYNDLSNKPTIPSAVTETTVSGWGFTKNAGTITGATMNGANVTATNGVLALGTVITSHQDISGKANSADLATVATSGSYNDLTNKPTIPSAVTETTVSGWGFTKNAGTVLKVNNTSPDANGNVSITIPTVNNATLTIQKNGTNVATFTANQSTAATANITVPTKVSDLTNDSGFTANTGTITGIKMNGASKGTSGEVDLGTVLTSHQSLDSCVKTSGNQTVAGVKTFTGNPVFSGDNVGAQLTVNRTNNASGYSVIKYANAGTVKGYLGTDSSGTPISGNASGTYVNVVRNSTLNTAVGSSSQPVYIASTGVATACTTADLKAGKDASGNTITSTYATKSELESALSTLATNLKNATID